MLKNLWQRNTRQPLLIIATLWSLVLLAPFVPGLPRPFPNGVLWRQELLLALLLCLTITLLAKQARQVELWTNLIHRRDVPLLLPLILFVLWSAASTLWAMSPLPALRHTFTWGAYTLFFLLVRRAAMQPKLLRASLTALAIVVWILSLSCIVEFLAAPNDSPIPMASLFRYSNGFGEMMAITIPIFASLALGLRQRRAALLCGATAVIAWLTMLQALERAPLIGASVALFALIGAALLMRQDRLRNIQRVVILIIALACATALQAVPSPLSQGRLSSLARLQTTNANEPNTRVRLLFWGIGLEMLRAHPLTGVGANNYEIAYPQARAKFSAAHSGSTLLAMHEEMLVERAHNEYVQLLAELGIVGFMFFLAFCAALAQAAGRALRRSRSALALGASASLIAFAISSGASAASFRWMGTGIMFFFAAALVSRFAFDNARASDSTIQVNAFSARAATTCALAFAVVMFCGMSLQAMNSLFHGTAQASEETNLAESFYLAALRSNPFDAGTNYNYGAWLFYQKRAPEAVPHLRYAVARGFNTSACYAYLAAAEAGAGDVRAAEQTLAQAVSVYPQSVFLRVRHATALAEIGNRDQANREYAAAVAINGRAARGWQQLISFGIDIANVTAHKNKDIALPGELSPANCVFAILAENERRTPTALLSDDEPLRAAAP